MESIEAHKQDVTDAFSLAAVATVTLLCKAIEGEADGQGDSSRRREDEVIWSRFHNFHRCFGLLCSARSTPDKGPRSVRRIAPSRGNIVSETRQMCKSADRSGQDTAAFCRRQELRLQATASIVSS